jgi:hypothetical protein
MVLTSTVMCISDAEVSVLRKYAGLEEKIVGMGLDGIWLLKPLLNVSYAIRYMHSTRHLTVRQ